MEAFAGCGRGRAGGRGKIRLLREMLRFLLRHRFLLIASVSPKILTAALGPVQGWLAKDVLDEFTRGSAVFALRDLLPYAWIALGVFLGMALLRLAEKVAKRALDDRILIDMQRAWFDRCGRGSAGERVARSINDCRCACKVFELFQRDLWVGLVGLPAVFIWQLSLEPRWLPALLAGAAPPFAIAVLFGGMIQRTSLRILQFVSAVGTAVAAGDRPRLCAHQESFFRQRIRFEFWKQCSEAVADLSRWLGAAIVLAMPAAGGVSIAPERVTAGQIGLFLVNLGLLTHPLAEITKIHNKIREGWPAVRRVLRPDAEPPDPGGPGGEPFAAGGDAPVPKEVMP